MGDYPAIQAVLEEPIPSLIIGVWSELAGEHSDTGQYAANTSFERMFPYQGNALSVAVANTSPHAQVLETGHSGFHLPSKVDWSGPKVRTSKKGIRYLVIPFRHGTPGTQGVGSGRARSMMGRDVYNAALTLFRNKRASDQAKVAARARIDAAGTQLSRPYALAGFPAALRAKAQRTEGQPGYSWRARTYEGLTYREQKNASGSSSGGYFTFRVMTEDSAGWFIPAFPGYGIAAKVVERVREQIRELVGEAARADTVELVALAVGEAA